ncbi:hypothetical protein TW1_041 [Pseudoalteromonas phage TW1]|uniref:hypothetical protein n=1 Tax=Pseudoalteromonas phage TW1 TaxID=1366055 RepID=UPI00035AB361|nr:hypothetical protein PP585_gp41 [Pseudoalteromonas phage TW1]AGR46557.1 hypothetical protein TW1_041 [Pseudoalteromonas phage TW1]
MKIYKLTLPNCKKSRLTAQNEAHARFKCRKRFGALPVSYERSQAFWWLCMLLPALLVGCWFFGVL